MGIRMFSPEEHRVGKLKPGETIPVHIELVCDGKHAGAKPTQLFTDQGYIAQRRAACAAGWRFSDTNGKIYCAGCK